VIVRIKALLAAGVLVTLAACSGGSAKKSTATSLATTTTKAPPIAPETGLPDPSGVSQTRSALWVKIENTPQARPQSGLDVADVVFEEVVDGGITRFITLFQSNAPDEVGPVRSVRPMDANVVWPLGGVFVYSGGVAENVARVNNAPVVAVDENNKDVLFRVNSRSAPHNLYARPAAAWKLGGKPVPPKPLFTYRTGGDVLSASAIPVLAFNVGFPSGYDVDWAWNAGTNSFDRSMQKVAFKAADGTQVSPANVVVQFTQYEGGVGRFNAEGIVVGSGEAWVFTNGNLIKGTWSRPTKDAVTTYSDATGAPIKLTPGRTWVEFAPAGIDVAVQAAPVTTTVAPAPTAPPTTAKR